MSALALRRLEFAELPRKALCVAVDVDEAVARCGGVLAAHRARGDQVRVVALTTVDGSAQADEARRAALALGVEDLRCVGFVRGELSGTFELAARVLAELGEFAPGVVYAPSPSPSPIAAAGTQPATARALVADTDHRATASACAAAAHARGNVRVLFYGDERARASTTVVVNTSAFAEHKLRALASPRTATAAARTASADEVFEALAAGEVLDWTRSAQFSSSATNSGEWAATAVISTWNKVEDVCANLDALRAQTRAFAQIVVVDNCSRDATAKVLRERYPDVRTIVMPHSNFGACETFNLGFAAAATPLTAILDDDVVLPPHWLEKTVERLQREPASTAIISTEVIEPGMPASFLDSADVQRERYMSTFRGCASLARTQALRDAEGYDERLFIYGNERDLTCRLLNLGLRVLHYPAVRAFHKTPFGIKMGKRSLYFHARNAWLTQLKYAPLGDLARLPWLVLTRVLLRGSKKEAAGEVTDATGTIGIGRSIKETPGSTWVLAKAACSVLANVPYCLKHRRPVRAPDFELPLK